MVEGNDHYGYKKREALNLSFRAGVQGFEPRLADPESAVLPLNDTPMLPGEMYNTASWDSLSTPLGLFFCEAPASVKVGSILLGKARQA